MVHHGKYQRGLGRHQRLLAGSTHLHRCLRRDREGVSKQIDAPRPGHDVVVELRQRVRARQWSFRKTQAGACEGDQRRVPRAGRAARGLMLIGEPAALPALVLVSGRLPAPVWKSNFGRPTPSTRRRPGDDCSMAWRFYAIDATLSK